jgi:chemotaxis protein MotB
LAKELGKLKNAIFIEGHTDSKLYDNAEYTNWELSADRANAARRLMQTTGLRRDQVTQVRGYADQQLRLPKNPEDPSNRRVSIIVQYIKTSPAPAPAPNTAKKPAEGGKKQPPAPPHS